MLKDVYSFRFNEVVRNKISPVNLRQIAEVGQSPQDCGPGVEGAHRDEAGLCQVAGVVEALHDPERLLLELGAGQPVDELGV